MLLTLVLDALGAIGLGKALEMLMQLVLGALLLGFIIYLGVRQWSRHIGKQFERAPDEERTEAS